MIVKYRSETPFGSGYRNAAEVMAYRTYELCCIDILDYLCDHYLEGNIRDKAKDYADNLSNNGFISDASLDTMQDFFRSCLSQIKKKTGKDVRYVLWLADENVVRDCYCQEFDDYTIDAYDISEAVVISDLGHDGKLYGFEREPEKMIQNKEETRMKAINIVWDVDGEDNPEEILENVPTEMEIPAGMTDVDEISDYLSDETGFCHKGFNLVKTLNVTAFCKAVYNSSIDVPADMNIDEAIAYAKEHLDEIPCGEMEYISDSDVLDEDNCDFDE